jgi:molecular chaperone DnaK (HSP70)
VSAGQQDKTNSGASKVAKPSKLPSAKRHPRRAVGLDFGTSTTLIAQREGDAPARFEPIGTATSWMPSVVASGGASARLIVGEHADNIVPEDRAVRSVKRAITEGKDTVSMKTKNGEEDLSVAEAVKAILTEAAARTNNSGTALTGEFDLRMGCPAMWTGEQRDMLRTYATSCGLPVASAELIDEPIAAGISWISNQFVREGVLVEGKTVVLDYGGGTLDIAVLAVNAKDGEPEITALSALGIGRAGDDLDKLVLADLQKEWAKLGCRLEKVARAEEASALALRAARDAKVALSTQTEFHVTLDNSRFPEVPALTYTRDQLEKAFGPQLDEATELTWVALRASKLCERGGPSRDDLMGLTHDELAKDISYVLLAGGLSQMPIVRRRLQELFPNAAVVTDGDPTESVAAGLTFTSGYERLNLLRPGFSLVLEWRAADGSTHEHTLYAAHTPLYKPFEILSGRFNLGLAMNTRDLELQGVQDARLKVVALDGTAIPLRIGTNVVPHFDVGFVDGRPMTVKLYVDGRLFIRDGKNREWDLRVDPWPVLRGPGSEPLQLTDRRDPGTPDGPMAEYAGTWVNPKTK